MSEPAEPRLQAACDAIAGYIARHPLAADNEEGIAQWWLPDMGVDVPLSIVRQALQGLLQCGLLACVTLPDGRLIFRAAAAPAAIRGAQRG